MIFFFIHIHADVGLCCCRVVYTISERFPYQTKHKSRPVSSPHRLLLLLWLFVIVFVRHEDLRFSYFSSFSPLILSSNSINIHAHTYSLILTMWFFSPSDGKSTTTTGRAAISRRNDYDTKEAVDSQKPLVCHHQLGTHSFSL